MKRQAARATIPTTRDVAAFRINSALDFALRYASSGYHVLPLRPRDKVPLTAHGALDASCDEAQIRAWWARWPTANVGLSLLGLVAVDIDPRNGADADSLPERLPDTCYAKTGGGWHYTKADGDLQHVTGWPASPCATA
jgi:hypothetical protein